MTSKDEKSYIFIIYKVFPVQLKRFESKILSDFERRAIFGIFGVLRKMSKTPKTPKTLVFRSPTRFLIQIFLIGPEILLVYENI